MRSYGCAKRDPIKNYFPLPNEIFVLGLNAGEIAVYAYLLFCENRKTFQCWPSCRSIGRATGMSVNTVRKHIRSLEAKGLIATEPTTITDRYGRRRNGNLLFTIRPIAEVVEQHYEKQLQGQSRCPAWPPVRPCVAGNAQGWGNYPFPTIQRLFGRFVPGVGRPGISR